MHGLINRSLQCFLRDSFGADLWREIAVAAQVPAEGFEPMLHYDDAVTRRLIDAAATQLERSGESLLEDLGTYLVSHPNREALRRLLRFGGVGFADFLDSIDDLPGRARLAVPDLELPQIELADDGPGRYRLCCRCPQEGFAAVLVGVLRAMADDYGALVMIEHMGREGAEDCIAIELLEHDFAEGRRFDLSSPHTPAAPERSGADVAQRSLSVTGESVPAAARTEPGPACDAMTAPPETEGAAPGSRSTATGTGAQLPIAPPGEDPPSEGPKPVAFATATRSSQ